MAPRSDAKSKHYLVPLAPPVRPEALPCPLHHMRLGCAHAMTRVCWTSITHFYTKHTIHQHSCCIVSI